jgi:hypothetical protein
MKAYDIETLVFFYQAGCMQARDRLLHLYHGYFEKFVAVLHHGNISLSDKVQRNFLRLFVKGEERANVYLYKKSEHIQKVLYTTLSTVRQRFRTWSRDDFYNEMVALFLELAMRHQKPGFKKYVEIAFPTTLYKRVREWELDPYFDNRIRFDESHYEIPDHRDLFDLIEWNPLPYRFKLPEDTMYPTPWINGECKEPFDILTPLERKILKWSYEKDTFGFFLEVEQGRPIREIPTDVYKEKYTQLKRTDTDIAHYLGCSRKTVNQIKREAIARLREYMIEHRLLKE